MGTKEVIDYVMNSPGNTNRAILKGLLNSVANPKGFDIIFSSETKTVDDYTLVILHPILLSTDLAMEDFLGARVFYTEETWDYVTHSSEVIAPVVTLCTQVFHFSEELPNVYSLNCNFDDDNPIYDSETGVLIAGYTTRMRQYFGEKNTYTAEEFKQMFALTRDILTDNAPKITLEFEADEYAVGGFGTATATVNRTLEELYNAPVWMVTADYIDEANDVHLSVMNQICPTIKYHNVTYPHTDVNVTFDNMHSYVIYARANVISLKFGSTLVEVTPIVDERTGETLYPPTENN